MADPQVAVVRDKNGLDHFASRYSKFVQDGLADGSLVEVEDGEPIASVPVATEPPRGGAGSGVDVWREYATGQGVGVSEDMTRDDVMAAVDALKGINGEAEPSEPGDDHDTGAAGNGPGDEERTGGTADGGDSGPGQA